MKMLDEKEKAWDRLNREEVNLNEKWHDLLDEKHKLKNLTDDTYYVQNRTRHIMEESLSCLQGSRYEQSFYDIYQESHADFSRKFESLEKKSRKVKQQSRIIEDRLNDIYYEKLRLSNS